MSQVRPHNISIIARVVGGATGQFGAVADWDEDRIWFERRGRRATRRATIPASRTCRLQASLLREKRGTQNPADNFSWITARIAMGRAPTTVKRTTPPVTARTLMFHPAGEPLTDRTVNGNPSWRMTPRTSSSTSVAFIER